MTKRDSLKYIFYLLGTLYFIVSSAAPLCRGGIFLLKEKPKDTVCVQGVVSERIKDESIGITKYYLEQGLYLGEYLTVNGERYYIITCGDITIGDSVEMDVLPRSKFVLRIERIEEDKP